MEHPLYNPIDNPEIAEREDRKKSLIGIAAISAGIAGAVTAVIPKTAKATGIADESYGVGVELGEDVNWIQKEGCPTSYTPGVGASQLMSGYAPNRFKLAFNGFAYNKEDCGAYTAIVAKEFKVDDAPDGGIITKGLGQALPLDPALINNIIDGQPICPDILTEVDRGDGRTAKIKQYGNDKIYKDDELKWEYGKGDCWSIVTSINPIFNNPKKIKIVTDSFWSDALNDFVGSAWRVNINEPDYCFAIQQSINDAWEKEGEDPYEAGLLNHVEDGTLIAPESDTLLLVDGYGGGPAFVKFDPVTQQYTHLKHNADGTYTPENPQKGDADFPGGLPPYKQNLMYPMALLKVETPSGKKIHLIANEGHKINWAGGFGDIRFFAVEELTSEKGETYFKDVKITIEETDQYPDDDKDGKINHEDNCRWRANPDQVNTTADKYGDSCKANCEQGGWPGVDTAPLQTNSSGLRICQSELGYDFVFSFEDGSTIHSNMDVEMQNGGIILKPGQTVRYIHSWDPRVEKLSAPNIALPAGNSVKIKVLSAKNLDGTNGQTIFTHDGNAEYFNVGADWQDFGIINNGEIENASDIEIQVGTENPLPIAEQKVEAAVEAGAEITAVVEQPAVAEPAGAELVATVEPSQAEPGQNAAEETVAIAEMPLIAVEAPNAAEEANIAEQPVVAEPMPDIFTEIQQSDTAKQSVDTVSDFDTPVGHDAAIDVSAQTDTSLEADTLSQADVFQNPDAVPKTDAAQKSDTSPQQDSSKDTAQNPDSVLVQPEKNKNENGSAGGCSCSISADSKPNSMPHQTVNVDVLPMAVGAVALIRAVRWALRRNVDRFMA